MSKHDSRSSADLESRFLDRFVLLALKLNEELKIIYANEAALRLLGTSEIYSKSVFDFFPHTPNLDDQFKKRGAGEGDTYAADLVRPKDGKRIPVSVTGTPILDENDNFIGAVGIIRNLEREKIADSIQTHLQTERNEIKLVELVAQELNKILPFDYFGVSLYSRDLGHLSSWIRYTLGESIETGRRWWPIAQRLTAQMQEPIAVPDFLTYMRENSLEEYLQEATVQKFIAQGYKSFLRVPITDRDHLVASLSLFSKERAAYTNASLARL